MRKTAVVAAALAAGLLGTAAPAGADTGYQVGSAGTDQGRTFGALSGSTVKPTRIGKIHKFAARSVRGAKVWGNWYWAKVPNQKAFVLMAINVKDTRSDGKSAGY